MFDKEVIPIVTNHKHFGLNISSDLTFRMHVKEIPRKANAALGPLYPIAALIRRHILKQIYVAYVRPIFDFSDVV